VQAVMLPTPTPGNGGLGASAEDGGEFEKVCLHKKKTFFYT